MSRRNSRASTDRRTDADRCAERALVDDPQVVLDAALRFLEARQRSVAEVSDRLTRAGYRADLVGGAIERLTGLGMLDDDAFARAWVESRDRAHPRGERALRGELVRKGIDREVIAGVLGDRAAGNPDDSAVRAGDEAATEGRADERAALALLERRRSSLERIADPRVRRQRAYALLARNGFDPETCGSAVRSSPALRPTAAEDGIED